MIDKLFALTLLQNIARKLGDKTIPGEDVIDIAQAALRLYDDLDQRLRRVETGMNNASKRG